MWRGVATQVRTHRTHGTQKIRRLRQDATLTDQTQGPFLLMHLVASGAFRDPCRHWVLSGHMPLSNPASDAS